jgi:hypothetical protein
MNAKQFNTLARRRHLTPEAKTECRSLDRSLPRANSPIGAASKASNRDATQHDLLTLPRRALELGCRYGNSQAPAKALGATAAAHLPW